MFTSCHLPADFVLKYLDSDIRESILFQSNLYMNQKQRSVPPMSLEGLYGFLGVNIVMGYHRPPSWTYYWKSDQDVTVHLFQQQCHEIVLLNYYQICMSIITP